LVFDFAAAQPLGMCDRLLSRFMLCRNALMVRVDEGLQLVSRSEPWPGFFVRYQVKRVPGARVRILDKTRTHHGKLSAMRVRL